MADTSSREKCLAFLETGVQIDTDAFLPWWEEHKDEPWAKERDGGELVNAWPWQRKHQSFLEHAMCHGCPEVVVRSVFAAHPAAAVGVDDDNRTALHAALGRFESFEGLSEDLVLDILNQWPDAAKKAESYANETPLNQALTLVVPRLSDSFLLQLIEAGGQEAAKIESTQNMDSAGTALNTALQWGNSAAVVEAIYNVWPGALDVQSERDDGQTPLEMYVFPGAPFEAIEKQLQTPIFKCDFDRCCFLLKYGCMNAEFFMMWWSTRKESDWVKQKLPEWDTEMKTKLQLHNVNYFGITLLHFAILRGAPDVVTLTILDAWKEAAHEFTAAGCTPLALAVKSTDASAVVVSALLDAWAGAAYEADTNGNAPLALAFEASTHVPKYKLKSSVPEAILIFKRVLDAWPIALVKKGCPLLAALKDAPTERWYKEVDDTTTSALCEYMLDAWDSMADKIDVPAHAPTLLHVALRRRKVKQVDPFIHIIYRIMNICPQLVQQKNSDGDTPLHVALKMGWAESIIEKLLTAWPDAITEANNDRETPLHIRIFPAAPKAAVVQHLRSFPSDTACCLSMFKSKEKLNIDLFLKWWQESRCNYADVDTVYDDETPPLLHAALLSNVPEPVMLAVLASSQEEAFSFKHPLCGTALEIGIKHHAPEAVLLAIINAWPDAVKEEAPGSHARGTSSVNVPNLASLAVQTLAPAVVLTRMFQIWPQAARVKTSFGHNDVGGNNLLHVLANAGNPPLHAIEAGLVVYNSISRNISINEHNALCFVLAGARVSATERNAGNTTRWHEKPQSTPGELAGAIRSASLMSQPVSCSAKDYYEARETRQDMYYKHAHLAATLSEIANFQSLPHLGKEHLRDWTTVSHAWCTPSAKLTALTVLLVGETYKRGLLPRLPMDCWYMILNKIPRYELRRGGCCKHAEEQAALVQYNAILDAAKSGT